MKEKMSKTKAFKIRRDIIVGVIVVILVIGIVCYNKLFKSRMTYTVINGYVEKTSDVSAVLIKSETVLNLDNQSTAVPVIEQNQRIAKDEIIAIYKNEKYDQYLKDIDDLDKDIQSLINDLPVTYSTELSNIDAQILKLAKEAQGVNSYLKLQEYKTKIDELSYKKVSMLGQLSPTGSKIRELIEKREKIEKDSKNSSNNIKAPISGMVSYKIDDLESVANIENINKYTVADFDNIFKKYGDNKNNKFGIKIVNNFEAYFVVKLSKGDNDAYIKENSKYVIKTNSIDNLSFTAKATRIVDAGDYNYIVFEISNGIEKIVENRTISLEIIWNKTEGMAVLKEAIKKSEDGSYDYVTLVTGGKYIDIPIKIKSSSDSVCIVDNLTKEEKTQLNIKSNYVLELYDILLI